MRRDLTGHSLRAAAASAAVVLGMLLAAASPADAQGPGTENGEWHYLGGDAWNTRYLPASQIDASNFDSLEVAWEWIGLSFGNRGPDLMRATPSYVDGVLYTVAGARRHVVAIDPSTGGTIWSFREPDTFRWEYSMRAGYGKGVAFTEVNGRKVIFSISPARFLWALDAETGKPLENWGRGVDLPGFSKTGVVDVLEDQARGWAPWEELKRPWDPYYGIPLEIGYATASSPPIVVNDVVIVGTSHEQGYNQTRIENIPGDIVAYDARDGKMKWKFHVIPRPGEYGHETWENDAWKWSGNIGSWAPMSADPELGLVYIPTKGGVLDYYGGFRPGDNLFGNSIVALDVQTGERRWHFQMVKHDVWNYDTPTAPILMDVTIDGRRVPVIAQATKQSFLYVLNRETGEPIWPMEERPVPQSKVPGEKLAETQIFPTWPLPYDLQGRTEDHLLDYTPEIRQRALEQARKGGHFAALFEPPTHRGNPEGAGPARICPGGGGGSNITGPPAADPVNGVVFVPSQSGCTWVQLVPGVERDWEGATGTTIVDWARGPVRPPEIPDEIDGLSIWKGPIGRITAIDLNTGEHLWAIPHGDSPEELQELYRTHPLLQGVDGVMINRGRGGLPSMMATETLVISSGTGADGQDYVYANDKKTGERVGAVKVPANSSYGMSGFVHEGRQYIMVQLPTGLMALRLPARGDTAP